MAVIDTKPEINDGCGERGGRIAYIHAMLVQLGAMAEADRCDMLAYLIEMASVEAADIARGQRAARGSSDPGKRQT